MDCTALLDTLAQRVPKDGDTYIDPDGILRCTRCQGTREVTIDLPGRGSKIVPCICRCMAVKRDRELQRLRDQEAHDRIQQMRSLGFRDPSLISATFGADDRKYPRISDALQRYVDHFEDFRRDGKGLLLYGPVGTGKTYYAACVVNALISKGHPALLNSLPRLINQVGGAKWEDRQPMIDHLADYHLVALDDLGTERQSEYVIEQMTAILDTLYRAGTPLIITTNQDPTQLGRASSIAIQRIWDRILERCHLIPVIGESRRKGKGQASYHDTKDILGL